MEKIVTHPLYIRCKKVIESCKTKEQKIVALRYIELAHKKINPGVNFITSKDYFMYLKLWALALKEV